MRVYVIVRHHKEETHRANMGVYVDKHVVKREVESLEKEHKKDSNYWFSFEKWDVDETSAPPDAKDGDSDSETDLG
jgi:hypothetical protein